MSGSVTAPNRAFPYDAVAYIYVTLSDGSVIQGSGAFISPNEILTAAHVLPDNAVSVSVDTGREGNDRLFGFENAASWVTDEDLTGKQTLSTTQSATDLGVITLPNDLGYETGWFSVGSGFGSVGAAITGYPDTVTGVEQTASPVSVTPDETPGVLDYPASATAPGSSGGPVWIGTAGQAVVGGVVSTDEFGPDISGATYAWVEQQIAAHAQPTEAAVSDSDFAGNAYAVGFYLGASAAEAGTGSPTPIGRDVIGTSQGDTILADAGQGGWTFTEGGGHVTINWASDTPYRSVSLTPDGAGGTIVSAPGTTIDINDVGDMHFVDGDLQFDTASDAAQVYRLYEGALGRAPDPVGEGNWVGRLQAGDGTTLTDVASGFLGSPEYAARFGAAQTPAQFVTLLYEQVLGRAPDAHGLARWTGDIADGQTYAQTLVDFTESPEFIADTSGAVKAGVWVPDESAASVARLYYSAFGRAPDEAGFVTNVQAVYGASSLDDLANDFAGSAEFLGKYGDTTNTQFVDLLYQNTLNRAPDAAGENNWVNALNNGYSRGDVLLGFSDSREHINDLLNVIDKAGVVFG